MEPKDRPCWNCSNVIPGKSAAFFRSQGMYSVRCSCGAWISLYGRPVQKRVHHKRCVSPMVVACPKCGSKDIVKVTVVLKRGKAKVKIPKDVPRKLGVMVICHTCGAKSTI